MVCRLMPAAWASAAAARPRFWRYAARRLAMSFIRYLSHFYVTTRRGELPSCYDRVRNDQRGKGPIFAADPVCRPGRSGPGAAVEVACGDSRLRSAGEL